MLINKIIAELDQLKDYAEKVGGQYFSICQCLLGRALHARDKTCGWNLKKFIDSYKEWEKESLEENYMFPYLNSID